MKRKLGRLIAFSFTISILTGCGISSGDAFDKSVVKPAKIEKIKAEKLTSDTEEKKDIDVNIASYDSIHDFSYELLKHNLDQDNPVLSPISAYFALAMAGNGARGETLEEFYELLGINLNTIPYEILHSLQREEEGMTVSFANSAWVDEQLQAEDTYLAAVENYFDAEVYQQKLSTQQAMDDMNIWVNAKTNGLIPAMINEPLDADTRLVLFNTIYFNGKWKTPFKGYSSRDFDFTTEDGNVTTAPMMQMYETDQLYVKNDIAEGVILPYKDEDLVFLALMPADEITVREMYEQLTWEDISKFLVQEETTLCNLRFPKFEVTFEKELNQSLKDMGLKRAFDGSLSDLSGLGTTTSGDNLFISLVKQKAILILDEEGTEASAATMVEVKEECAVEYDVPPVNLYFDNPFLYMIVDKTNDIPLFVGIMDAPKES